MYDFNEIFLDQPICKFDRVFNDQLFFGISDVRQWGDKHLARHRNIAGKLERSNIFY